MAAPSLPARRAADRGRRVRQCSHVRQPSALSTSVVGSCRSSPALAPSCGLAADSRPLSLSTSVAGVGRCLSVWCGGAVVVTGGRGPDRSVVDSGSSLRQRASEAISKITIRVRFANSHAMPIITQSQACDHWSRRQLTWKTSNHQLCRHSVRGTTHHKYTKGHEEHPTLDEQHVVRHEEHVVTTSRRTGSAP